MFENLNSWSKKIKNNLKPENIKNNISNSYNNLLNYIKSYRFHYTQLFTLLKILIIIVVSIFVIFPIYYLIAFSFFTNAQATSNEASFVSNNFSFDAYIQAFNNGYLSAFLYSFIFVAIVVFLRLIILILGAYGLTLLSKKIRNIVFTFFIVFASIPEITLHIGFLYQATEFNWSTGMNVLNALIFPNLFSIFITLIFVQAFQSIEAQKKAMAKLDNLSWFNRIRVIYLPNLKSSIWISIFFSIIFSLNSFIWPSIILAGSEVKVLAIWFRLSGSISANLNLQNVVAAGAVLSLLPIVIFYFVFSKKINKISATIAN
ncbi:hypothetical protein CJJ23_00735 [Mycoplasmopsis agassizii]|uniref:ABC transmembrane type-1 domain-containing protein n=1 Tax=Mycoplasmopsis agassizii TaxID=33922 RepID=A0A269TKQ7_9BACT|nr:ABC transporter permease subunit [Mycoplasmopsis agassizii]PAK21646.1 hypothetical protein CJJ23_00735 [Mycoplasmopsis agassizii]